MTKSKLLLIVCAAIMGGAHLLATELTQEILDQKIQAAQAGEKVTVDFGDAG